MEKKDKEQLKRALEETRRSLEQQVRDLEKAPDFGSDVDSFEEETEETEAVGVNLGIHERLRKRLELVREALEKMRRGVYGRCERCGREIDRELLVADPESELCRECKARPRR